MMRSIFLTAVFALTACAAPAADAPPTLSSDLSCNAGEVQDCPVGGCTAANPGEASTIYISLLVPRAGGEGNFCIATGCESATYTTPASTTSGPVTSQMTTNDRTEYRADLQIARDLRTFTLRQADGDGVSTWTGECSAAGS